MTLVEEKLVHNPFTLLRATAYWQSEKPKNCCFPWSMSIFRLVLLLNSRFHLLRNGRNRKLLNCAGVVEKKLCIFCPASKSWQSGVSKKCEQYWLISLFKLTVCCQDEYLCDFTVLYRKLHFLEENSNDFSLGFCHQNRDSPRHPKKANFLDFWNFLKTSFSVNIALISSFNDSFENIVHGV